MTTLSQSLDEEARAHQDRFRTAQAAFEAHHCNICFGEYGTSYVMTPCCQHKLCDGCSRRAYEGSVFHDVFAGSAPDHLIATGSTCPYCRATWNEPPACVVHQETPGLISQDQCDENTSMHGEGGHYMQLLGSGSGFVDRDCEAASAVA